MKRIFAARIEDWRILGISENEVSDKPPKIEPPAMFAITKTNVADDAIEVEDDSTTHGSGKERDNRSLWVYSGWKTKKCTLQHSPLIGWPEGGAGQAIVSETNNAVLQVSKYWDSIINTYLVYKNMIC